MARPINRNVSKTTSLGLSKNGIKGALATAVLGTLAAAATTNIVESMQAKREARKTKRAAKAAADAA